MTDERAPPTTLGLCTDCLFFDRAAVPTVDYAGMCRRSAPITGMMRAAQARNVDEVNLARFAVWPIVADSDWCGEWKGK